MVQESGHADVEAVVEIAQAAVATEISSVHGDQEELLKVLPSLWHLAQLSSNQSLE